MLFKVWWVSGRGQVWLREEEQVKHTQVSHHAAGTDSVGLVTVVGLDNGFDVC